MENFKLLFGQWFGSFNLNDKVISFSIMIESVSANKFTGICIDYTGIWKVGEHIESSKIEGLIESKSIEFNKKYSNTISKQKEESFLISPHLYFKANYIIESKTFIGTWQSVNNETTTSKYSGNWEMSREGSFNGV